MHTKTVETKSRVILILKMDATRSQVEFEAIEQAVNKKLSERAEPGCIVLPDFVSFEALEYGLVKKTTHSWDEADSLAQLALGGSALDKILEEKQDAKAEDAAGAAGDI